MSSLKDRNQSHEAACLGKHAFQSGGDAQKALKKRRKHKEPLVSYRCPFCRKFHIGIPAHR